MPPIVPCIVAISPSGAMELPYVAAATHIKLMVITSKDSKTKLHQGLLGKNVKILVDYSMSIEDVLNGTASINVIAY